MSEGDVCNAGESAFSSICAKANMIANSSRVDKTGYHKHIIIREGSVVSE